MSNTNIVDMINREFAVPESLQIFTTLRYDPSLSKQCAGNVELDESCIYSLNDHIAKLNRSARYFQIDAHISKETILDGISAAFSHNGMDNSIPHRVKVSIALDGSMHVEMAPLPETHRLNTEIPQYASFQESTLSIPKYLHPWSGWYAHLDSQPSSVSPYTSFKTNIRDTYNAARRRRSITVGDRREVILYDGSGYLLEGSITSIACWREKDSQYAWVTPHLGRGCMDGIMRRKFIDTREIIQGDIEVGSLMDGEIILLMNALMGVQPAIVRLQ